MSDTWPRYYRVSALGGVPRQKTSALPSSPSGSGQQRQYPCRVQRGRNRGKAPHHAGRAQWSERHNWQLRPQSSCSHASEHHPKWVCQHPSCGQSLCDPMKEIHHLPGKMSHVVDHPPGTTPRHGALTLPCRQECWASLGHLGNSPCHIKGDMCPKWEKRRLVQFGSVRMVLIALARPRCWNKA